MMLMILAAAYLAAIFFDFRQYLRGGAKGEKALYLALLAISLFPLVLNELGFPLPPHTKPIEQAVRAIFRVP